LWLSVVGAGVIALYVLKIKRHQQVVPALDFWRQLAGRTKVHSLFQRLKRLLSMLLWLLIAACLVLALGNPILSLGRIKPRAIAVVIDNSASMQTVEVDSEGRTRLQLAIAALNDITSRRPVNDEWLLIEAARDPRVAAPWTYDHKAVHQAAEGLEPFNGSGDLPAAVDLAGQLLAGKVDPCIVLISDGAAGKVRELTQRDSRIIDWPVGQATDNLGITRLAVRLHRQQVNHHVLVSAVNASNDKIDTQLTFEIDGVANGVELLSIEPQGTWEKTVVIDAPTGGVLRASIDRADALMLDNEAYAILEPIRPAVVWLVSPDEEAFFFEQALAAMDPLVWPDESLTLTIDQYERVMESSLSLEGGDRKAHDSSGMARSLRSPDLVIFNNCTPAKLPLTGRFVLVNAWPSEIPAIASGTLDAPQLFLTPRPHPITQHLSLHGVRLAQARHVTLNDAAAANTILAHSADGDPLIFLCDVAAASDHQALCLAFNVLESDLPFRNSFPLLLRNAVAFMHADAPSWLKGDYRIGETMVPSRPLPAAATSVDLVIMRGDQMQQITLPVRDGRFVMTDTGRSGAVRASFADETAYSAVNLADGEESRIEPATPQHDPAQQLVLSGRLFGAMPWIGFAVAAALLIALEWLTFNFRWTE
jgi:hypothetical protein